MHPNTNFVINAIRKALRLMQRDCFELEILQSSQSKLSEFCSKSYSKTKQLLIDELGKSGKPLIFSDDIDGAGLKLMIVNDKERMNKIQVGKMPKGEHVPSFSAPSSPNTLGLNWSKERDTSKNQYRDFINNVNRLEVNIDQLSMKMPEKNLNQTDMIFLINVVDNKENFMRTLPFFAVTIVTLKKIGANFVPVGTVMHFPVLGDILYAEKGGGTWIERALERSDTVQRARISSCTDLSKATSLVDDIKLATAVASDNLSSWRHFGSVCYDVAMFAMAKADIIHYFSPMDEILKIAAMLAIIESGAGAILKDDEFIATNYNLIMKMGY